MSIINCMKISQLVEEQKHGDTNTQKHMAIWSSCMPTSLP